MAIGDSRRIVQVIPDKDGRVSAQGLNEALRQMSEQIYALEGRLGEVTIREDTRVMGALTLPARVDSSGEEDDPEVSDANEGRVYFDLTEGKLKVSEDGGVYENLTSPLTTKGDIHTFSMVDARLPAGTNGQILHVDSTTDTGLIWKGTVGCRIYNSTVVSIPSGVWTPVTFDSERFDTDTMHSTVTNPARITFNTPGKYLVGSTLAFASNAAGNYRLTSVHWNNTDWISVAAFPFNASAVSYMVTNTIYDFAAGEYVEFRVYQDTGGNLNVGGSSSHFAIEAWAILLGV